MSACDARWPLAASSGQPDLTDLEGLRHRCHLVLSSNSEDKAQDRVPLVERMRQVPQVLHHSLALLSVPTAGARTSSAMVDAGGTPGAPPTSSLPWDASLWGFSLNELL
jgi:hypothetical protein